MPHLFACGRLLLIGIDPEEDDDWKAGEDMLTMEHHLLYLRSLYWCIGAMTGYADVRREPLANHTLRPTRPVGS